MSKGIITAFCNEYPTQKYPDKKHVICELQTTFLRVQKVRVVQNSVDQNLFSGQYSWPNPRGNTRKAQIDYGIKIGNRLSTWIKLTTNCVRRTLCTKRPLYVVCDEQAIKSRLLAVRQKDPFWHWIQLQSYKSCLISKGKNMI